MRPGGLQATCYLLRSGYTTLANAKAATWAASLRRAPAATRIARALALPKRPGEIPDWLLEAFRVVPARCAEVDHAIVAA